MKRSINTKINQTIKTLKYLFLIYDGVSFQIPRQLSQEAYVINV